MLYLGHVSFKKPALKVCVCILVVLIFQNNLCIIDKSSNTPYASYNSTNQDFGASKAYQKHFWGLLALNFKLV